MKINAVTFTLREVCVILARESGADKITVTYHAESGSQKVITYQRPDNAYQNGMATVNSTGKRNGCYFGRIFYAMKRWPYCHDCGWHKNKCPKRPWYSWFFK